LLRTIYHAILKLVLRLVGLDFSWYLNFYRKWPHALPVVEVCIQKFRPVRESFRFFSDYDIPRFAKPGDVVLDIGANVGDVSSHLLKLGYVVHAYEPDDRCAEFLRRRFAHAGKTRFHLHQGAVSNYDGVAVLYRGALTTESSSILENKPGTESVPWGEVTVHGIQGILEELQYVALIMMDIEGAEYDVLEGMLKPEYRDRFGLCIAESHANKMPTLIPRHRHVVDTIARFGLEERVLLDWH
jgi:FkbM family methyltransferase